MMRCKSCALQSHQISSSAKSPLTNESVREDSWTDSLDDRTSSFHWNNGLHLTPQNALRLLSITCPIDQPCIYDLICRYINRHIVEISEVDSVPSESVAVHHENIPRDSRSWRCSRDEICSLNSETMRRILTAYPAKKKEWYVILLAWCIADRERRQEDYKQLSALLFQEEMS